jgi:hypothetical protein
LAETSTACPAGVVAFRAVERAWVRAFCWRRCPPERERDELPDFALEREPLDFERALDDLALLLLDFGRLLLLDFARELLLERDDDERELEDFARDPPDREREPPDFEPPDFEPPDLRCPLPPSAMSALPHQRKPFQARTISC